MRRQRRQLGAEIRRVAGRPRERHEVALPRPCMARMAIGMDQEKIVRLELGLEGVERLVEGGLGPCPVDRHLVRRVVSGPVAHGMRRAVVVERAVVVQAGDVCGLEPVLVAQRAVQKLQVIDVPVVRHPRNRIA